MFVKVCNGLYKFVKVFKTSYVFVKEKLYRFVDICKNYCKGMLMFVKGLKTL